MVNECAYILAITFLYVIKKRGNQLLNDLFAGKKSIHY